MDCITKTDNDIDVDEQESNTEKNPDKKYPIAAN